MYESGKSQEQVGAAIGRSTFAPMANTKGRILKHRLVIARHLGRPLRDDETVHHKDGDPANNDLENLQLRQGRHGKGVRFVCCACGSNDVRPAEVA